MQTTASEIEIRPLAPTDRDLDRLTQIDHHDHEAVAAIAADSGQIVGVARYIALPHDPGAAEVAIAVDDEWQGRGIGRRLMSRLADRARAEGLSIPLDRPAEERRAA